MSTPLAAPNPAPPTPAASSPALSAPPPAPSVSASPPILPITPPPAASPPSPAALNSTPPATAPPLPLTSPPPPPPSNSSTSPPLPPPTHPTPPTAANPPPPSFIIRPSPPPPFQKPPVTRAPPPPQIGSSANSGVSNTVIVGAVVGGAVLLAIITILAVCLTRKKSRGRSHSPGSDYGSSRQKEGGLYEAGRRHRYDFPYPPPEVPGKPYSPTQPPPLPLQSLKPNLNAYQETHSIGSAFDSGSTTDGPPLPPPPPKFSAGPPHIGVSKSSFTYADLERATNGFSRANLLGEGGFGFVFKGILTDGKEVAVKQLKVGGGQGEREFQAEVEIIGRVHHRHLVSLVGYCIADNQRMLVYEFVPNGTLEYHLHAKGRPIMDWSTRVKIAIGAARGLAYLHEDCHPRIIHRDIKSSNILLDYQFEAQVSDFGLAKLASDAHTHVTTRVMGTFGYLAPEYASTGKLTDKSDVYSFGVVLLELLTGRKPVDSFGPLGDDSLVEWARPLLSQALDDGVLEGLVDPRLGKTYNEKEVKRMIEAAAACVRHSAHKRPRLGQVVRALEGDSADLNHGIRPGHSLKYDSPYGSADYDTMQYNSDLKRFKKMALAPGSQEYGSGYSGATSEYGLNPSASSSEYQSSKELDRKAMSSSKTNESGSSENLKFSTPPP